MMTNVLFFISMSLYIYEEKKLKNKVIKSEEFYVVF